MHKAKKSFGQHFLDNEDIFQQMLPQNKDTSLPILEIGPGTGNLTAYLLHQRYRVFCIEKDPTLIPHLQQRFSDTPQCTIYYDDALTCTLPGELNNGYRIIANIPYYITQPLLHHYLWEVPIQPAELTLMVQDEVAHKYAVIKPPHTFLSATTSLIATSTYEMFVHRSHFSPPPKVDSAILRIHPYHNTPPQWIHKLTSLMGVCFAQGRKKLSNTVPKQYHEQLRVTFPSLLEKRPEELTTMQWNDLGELIFSQK